MYFGSFTIHEYHTEWSSVMQSLFTNMFSKMFSRKEICFWKCARTIQNTQSVSSKLYSAQAGKLCYKRSGSEVQFTDCYTLLGFDFCSDYTITTRYNDFNCKHNLTRCWRTSFLTSSGMPHHPIQHQIDIMTLSSQPGPRNILWILHYVDILTLTPLSLWHYHQNQKHEILYGYYIDISPGGYYVINSTTCSGMGSSPHSWYNGGRGSDLDGGK